MELTVQSEVWHNVKREKKMELWCGKGGNGWLRERGKSIWKCTIPKWKSFFCWRHEIPVDANKPGRERGKGQCHSHDRCSREKTFNQSKRNWSNLFHLSSPHSVINNALLLFAGGPPPSLLLRRSGRRRWRPLRSRRAIGNSSNPTYPYIYVFVQFSVMFVFVSCLITLMNVFAG